MNYLLDTFLIIQKIITRIITIIIIPTHTPALKIVPIAWQLSNVRIRRRDNGISFSKLYLFIIIVFSFPVFFLPLLYFVQFHPFLLQESGFYFAFQFW